MSDIFIWAVTAFTLSCILFNICWWLYGRTLSEIFPAPLVAVIMLTTLFGFFFAFKLLFVEVCNNFISPDWGYVAEHDEFVPFAKDIAHVLAGVLTVGMAILMYKDEGKISNYKYKSDFEDRKTRRDV